MIRARLQADLAVASSANLLHHGATLHATKAIVVFVAKVQWHRMKNTMDFPFTVSALCFVALWFSARVGFFFVKSRPLHEDQRDDFNVVQAGALTLLGLLIGFTFSMAIGRYDQRKNYEEAEANAIGTEYVRVDVLPATDAAKVRDLLRRYVDLRVLFYTAQNGQQLQQINADTAKLQNELWSAVEVDAPAQPTPLTALALAGMNDVLNSQGYTQAAWWNRIPLEAWVLLVLISVGCNMLIGYGAHRRSALFIVLPLAVSVSFFLIADIDSPRGGIIRVQPQNLISLAQGLTPQ